MKFYNSHRNFINSAEERRHSELGQESPKSCPLGLFNTKVQELYFEDFISCECCKSPFPVDCSENREDYYSEHSHPLCISATGSIAEDNMVEIGRAVAPPSKVTSSGILDVAVKNLEDYCNGWLTTWVHRHTNALLSLLISNISSQSISLCTLRVLFCKFIL